MNIQIISLFIMAMILLQVALVIFGNVGTLCDSIGDNGSTVTTLTFKEKIPVPTLTGNNSTSGLTVSGDTIWLSIYGTVGSVGTNYFTSSSYLSDGEKPFEYQQKRLVFAVDALDVNSNNIYTAGRTSTEAGLYVTNVNSGVTKSIFNTTSSNGITAVATDSTNIYMGFNNGTIARGDINHSTHAITNLGSFMENTRIASLTIHDNKLYLPIRSNSVNTVAFQDLDEITINLKYIPTPVVEGLHTISDLGVSDDYILAIFDGGSDAVTIYDKSLGVDVVNNGWKTACENQEKQSQGAYGVISIIVIIIAAVGILGFVKYF